MSTVDFATLMPSSMRGVPHSGLDFADEFANFLAYPEAKRRVRWLTKEEVLRLLHALPPHQRQTARFALATGLRQANVLGMRWSDVDLDRRTAWVHAHEAKGGQAIGVPLNEGAMAVLL